MPVYLNCRTTKSNVMMDSMGRQFEMSAVLEVIIARVLYGLSLDDRKYFTGTLTFGSGSTEQELDETIRQSLGFWSE